MNGKGPAYWIIEIGACAIILVVVFFTMIIALDATITWMDKVLSSRKMRRARVLEPQSSMPSAATAARMSHRVNSPSRHA